MPVDSLEFDEIITTLKATAGKDVSLPLDAIQAIAHTIAERGQTPEQTIAKLRDPIKTLMSLDFGLFALITIFGPADARLKSALISELVLQKFGNCSMTQLLNTLALIHPKDLEAGTLASWVCSRLKSERPKEFLSELISRLQCASSQWSTFGMHCIFQELEPNDRECIKPLIDYLRAAEGADCKRKVKKVLCGLISDTLHNITGEEFKVAEDWQRWWERSFSGR